MLVVWTSSKVIGVWCNWQHSGFWYRHSRFESWYPSKRFGGDFVAERQPVKLAKLSSGRTQLIVLATEVWLHSKKFLAPSSSGLGRRPLKAVARVRIPSGLQRTKDPLTGSVRGSFRSVRVGLRLRT